MPAAHSSAGVYVKELDLSQRVVNASTSIGAIVGQSKKGPVMERTLITSVRQFVEVFGKPDPRTSFMHYCALQFLTESARLYVTRVSATDALTAGCYWTVDDITAANPLTRLTSFDAGNNTPKGVYDPLETLGFNPTTPGIENVLGFFAAVNPGTWNNDIYIQVKPSTKKAASAPEDPYVFWVDVFLQFRSPRQLPDESFLVSRDFRIDGFGNQMNIEEVINNKSNIIRFKANPYAVPKLKILDTASEFLDGATDGSRVTDGMICQGWELYRDTEYVDVNILINGGYATPAVQNKIDDICQDRMDCIGVLDVPPTEQDVARAVTYRRNDLNLDSSRSALYSPDLRIYDQYNDLSIFVPPSGHVAAAYARTDYVTETWFAPAGMSRGDLKILGVRKTYNQGDRDALVDAQINPMRVFPGKGYKIWGADTLQVMGSALSNVNVRRLLNFVEKSISIASLYSVYNPNDEILWAQLRELCERFLTPIQRGRGLYWFKVVCDETNNRPDTIALGNTILDVYLDPVIYTKRIHLNAVVMKTGTQYKESLLP